MKKCPIRKSRFFGDSIIHTWGYITNEHRKCFTCKTEETLFGVSFDYGEDWRTKYK